MRGMSINYTNPTVLVQEAEMSSICISGMHHQQIESTDEKMEDVEKYQESS